MKMARRPKKRTTTTDSIQELAEFWDSHDLTDFKDELKRCRALSASRVTVPLNPAKSKVEQMAQAQGIPREELIRAWCNKNSRAAKRNAELAIVSSSSQGFAHGCGADMIHLTVSNLVPRLWSYGCSSSFGIQWRALTSDCDRVRLVSGAGRRQAWKCPGVPCDLMPRSPTLGNPSEWLSTAGAFWNALLFGGTNGADRVLLEPGSDGRSGPTVLRQAQQPSEQVGWRRG